MFMPLEKYILWNVNMYSEWEYDQRLYYMECVWEVSNHRVVLYSTYWYRERSYCAIISFLYRKEATFIHKECRPTQNSSRSVMPIFDKNWKKNLKFLFIFRRFVKEDLSSLLIESAKVLKEKAKGGEWEALKMPVLLILATSGICKRILYVGHFCFSVCIICKVFLKILFKKQSFVPRCISISI